MRQILLFSLLTFFASLFSQRTEDIFSFAGDRQIASTKSALKKCNEAIKSFLGVNEESSIKAHLKNLTLKYLGEVKETKGLRLFLKNIDQYKPEKKYFVFLPYTPPENLKWYSNPFNRSFQFFPKKITTHLFGNPYEFYPLSGLSDFLIGKPVRLITNKFLNEEKEFTLLLTAPVSFGLFWMAYEQFDESYQEALNNHLKDKIEKDAKAWDRLIESEFSLNGIRMLLKEGKISKKEARQKAYQYVGLLNNYYKTMNEFYPKMSEEDRINWSLNHPLFLDIKKISIEGIHSGDEYIYQNDFQNKLSKEQIAELLDCVHALYATDNIISDMIKNPKDNNYDISVVNVRNQIRNDSFAKYLFQLKKTKKITDDELTYRLQEDAFWQTRFKKWEIVRVIKRKKVQGVYTADPLRLDDIRQEVMEELVANHKE